MKREAQHKALFTKELARVAPDLMVLQLTTRGAPDRQVLGRGKVSFWEFKHATPSFEAPLQQQVVCAKIAQRGIPCFYVVFHESRLDRCIYILQPEHVAEFLKGDFTHIEARLPYTMHALTKWVLGYHL